MSKSLILFLLPVLLLISACHHVTGPAEVFSIPSETEQRELVTIEYYVVRYPPVDTADLGNLIRDYLQFNRKKSKWDGKMELKRVFLEESSISPRNFTSSGPDDHLGKNLEDIRCIQTRTRLKSKAIKTTYTYFDSDGMPVE